MKNRLILLMTVFFYAVAIMPGLIPTPVLGQTQVTLDELNRQVQSLQAQKDNYDFLKQEMSEYRKFLERQQEEHRKFLELCYGLVGFVIVTIGGILGFFGWRTIQGFKKSVNDYCESHLLKLVDKKGEELIAPLHEVQRKIREETAYRNSAILVVAPEIRNKEVNEDLVIPLNERGIKNIRIESKIDTLSTMIRDNCFRAVVRYYDPKPPSKEGKDPELHRLVNLLTVSNTHIPLIIYTFGVPDSQLDNKLSDTDNNKIKNYRYAVPSNFCLSLLERVLMSVLGVKPSSRE